MVYVALIGTTLLAVACLAGAVEVWRGGRPGHAGVRGVLVVGLVALAGLALVVHPVVNRWLFAGPADRKTAAIEGTLGGTEAELVAAAGEPDLVDPQWNAAVWTYEMGGWPLLWPREHAVQVIVMGGRVMQVVGREERADTSGMPGAFTLEDMQDAEQTDQVVDGAEDAVEADGGTPAEAGEPGGEPKANTVKVDASELALRVEAAVLTTDRAMGATKLAEACGGVAVEAVRAAVESLNQVYEESGRSFRVELVGGGYQFMTLPRYAEVLRKVKQTRAQNKLSPAALETLAVVAYKQPVLRADVEAIRGVSCGETLRGLMERGLVRIAGRSEELGRPMLYGTTQQFLELFGLNTLKDLPKSDELRVSS